MISFQKACRHLEVDRGDLNWLIKQLEITPRKAVKGRNWQFLRDWDFLLIKHTITLLNEGLIEGETLSPELVRRLWSNKRHLERKAVRKKLLEEQRQEAECQELLSFMPQITKIMERREPLDYRGLFQGTEKELIQILTTNKLNAFRLYMEGHTIAEILKETEISRSTLKRWRKTPWWKRLHYDHLQNNPFTNT